jgi:hypothetical protein
MHRLRPHLTYANVVSTLCLFVLLGGVAYAGIKLPANSVGTKQLKPSAVNGDKVADGSLSAADIGGPVNNATNAVHANSADQATNASLLGGSAPSSFLASAKVKSGKVDVLQTANGSRFDDLINTNPVGPLDLLIQCARNTSANTQTLILEATGKSGVGGTIGFGAVVDNADTDHPITGSTGTTGSPVGVFSRLVGAAVIQGPVESGSGQAIYRDDNTSISLIFRYTVNFTTGQCLFIGQTVQE